jgi:hypothetical protein
MPEQIDIVCLLATIDRERHAMPNVHMLKLLLFRLHRFTCCLFLTACPSRFKSGFQ